jgi:hypothetical protein
MFDEFRDFGWQLLQRLPEDPQQRLLALLLGGGVFVALVLLLIHRRRTASLARPAKPARPQPTPAAPPPVAPGAEQRLVEQGAPGRAGAPASAPPDSGPAPAPAPAPNPDPAPIRDPGSLTFAFVQPPPVGQPRTGRRLVLFIHGLLSTEERCWGRFPEFLLADPAIANTYDVATFGYHTSPINLGTVPKLEDVALYLRTEIGTTYRDYSEVVLCAHSMGGLIARRYIADALQDAAGGAPRVSRVMFLATPHRGSVIAGMAGLGASAVSGLLSLFGSAAQAVWDSAVDNGASAQFQALASGSDFLFQLEQDEERAGVRDRITMRYVIAEDDVAVEKTSGVASNDFHVVAGTDHWSVARPDTADHASVRLLRQFLTETQDQAPFEAKAELRQPVLQRFREDTAAGTDDRKRFVFKNQAIPLVGREDEFAHLEAFLAPHQSAFRWMVLAGSGGVGKSRLALELCQAKAAHHWNAGFARPELETIDWRTWQPRMPTLIAIDYAGRLAEKVGSMLAGLAEREPAHALRFPVRVLVIERDAGGAWLDTIQNASDRVDDSLTRHAAVVLVKLDDPWPMFEAVAGGTKLGREATLAALAGIDDQQRPLFAYLMADAIANDKDVGAWDKAVLLRNIIDRDRQHYWRGPAANGAHGQEEPISAAEERALLPGWNLDRHPRLYGGGDRATGAGYRRGIPRRRNAEGARAGRTAARGHGVGRAARADMVVRKPPRSGLPRRCRRHRPDAGRAHHAGGAAVLVQGRV